MGQAERRNKDQAMAAELLRMGYPHGRRRSKGLSNIPNLKERGSAAYRRLMEKRMRRAA